MPDLFTLAGVDVPSTAPAYLDTPLGALLEMTTQKEKHMPTEGQELQQQLDQARLMLWYVACLEDDDSDADWYDVNRIIADVRDYVERFEIERPYDSCYQMIVYEDGKVWIETDEDMKADCLDLDDNPEGALDV
jgi:hypothetical protein